MVLAAVGAPRGLLLLLLLLEEVACENRPELDCWDVNRVDWGGPLGAPNGLGFAVAFRPKGLLLLLLLPVANEAEKPAKGFDSEPRVLGWPKADCTKGLGPEPRADGWPNAGCGCDAWPNAGRGRAPKAEAG